MEWHKRDLGLERPSGVSEVDYLALAIRACKGQPLKQEFFTTALEWCNGGKPYYNVWPHIADGLSRVRLDVPAVAMRPLIRKLPRVISVRFPKGHPIGEFLLRCTFVEDNYAGMGLWIGKAFSGFTLVDGLVEDSLQRAKENRGSGYVNTMDYAVTALRIALGIAMLHDNPDMVEAVVLRKDQAKYAATRDPKYVEKAKRRGEYGFNVGANIEVLPHFRRPHFAIRWTGKGHEVPKLVPVKGCVVKRSKFTEVPTGYQADEEAESLAV